MQSLKLIVKETFSHWRAQNPSRMSASLSYFAILSMAPLFVLLITLVSLFVNANIVEGNLLYQISSVVGSDVTNFISDIISSKNIGYETTIMTGIISFITLSYGALGVFRELSFSIDKIWSTTEENKPRRTKKYKQIFTILKNQIPLFLLIIILAFLFLASILAGVSFQIIGNYLNAISPTIYRLVSYSEPIVSFIFVALFFGTIYRVVPKIKLPFSEIAFGASVTAIIFLIGELVIGSYLGHYINSSVFGAAISLISIMLWVYFSAQIFFFGASFTVIYSKLYGSLKNK